MDIELDFHTDIIYNLKQAAYFEVWFVARHIRDLMNRVIKQSEDWFNLDDLTLEEVLKMMIERS